MDGYVQFLLLLLGGAFVGALLLSALTGWRILVAAIAISGCVFAFAATYPPELRMAIEFGFWNALVAFIPALVGAALGARIRRKRIG